MRWQQVVLTGLIFLLGSSWVFGFYSWEENNSKGDVRGLLRVMGSALDYPDSAFAREQDEQTGLFGRLIAKAKLPATTFELNAYQTWLPRSQLLQQTGATGAVSVERSASLEWEVSDDRYAHLALDRLSARWSVSKVDITLGRQPINLATTFFFSPNDLFAPFAAQSFYRVYKPGVDALRTEVQLGELSQLSLIGVMGYQPDPASITGWSDNVDRQRHAYLARVTTNFAGMEWGLITGKVRRNRLQGASIQGDFFGGLGLRAEGHVAEPIDGSLPRYSELSIGLEYRWESSLMIQFEQFYHGWGANSVPTYDLLNNTSGYLARRYHALGAGYEFSPLLTGQMSLIRNDIDHSFLLSNNLLYSLSDESELSINLTLSGGERFSNFVLQSEYGSLPAIFSLELRAYF